MEHYYELWSEQMIAGADLALWQEFFVKFWQAFIEKDRYLQYLKGVGTTLWVTAMALLLGIAPQILTVPAIMAGNTVFVVLLYYIAGKDSRKVVRQIAAWLSAAAAKFAVLYAIVNFLICGVLAEGLMASGMLKAPMLTALPATFSWPQLFTALIGGAVALLITPVLRKALKK